MPACHAISRWLPSREGAGARASTNASSTRTTRTQAERALRLCFPRVESPRGGVHQRPHLQCNSGRGARGRASIAVLAAAGEQHATAATAAAAASGAEPSDLRGGALVWAVAKPPIYTVALVPLAVGSAAAYLVAGTFSPGRFWLLLVSSVLVIAWLNLSNDAYDAATGVDESKPESLVNVLGGGRRVAWAVLAFAYAALLAGLAGLVLAASFCITSGGGGSAALMLQLLAAAVACGYVYQSPPFRLSYKGLGEPLCFLAFGPCAVTAFYLSQLQGPAVGAAAAAAGVASTSTIAALATVPALVWACAALVGLTTTSILFCSHFHQIEGDLAAGKMSPLVRLGPERAAVLLRMGVGAVYLVAALAAYLSFLPLPAALLLIGSVPAAKNLLDFVEVNKMAPEKIFKAKFFAVKWHTVLGLCLTLGLYIGRLLA